MDATLPSLIQQMLQSDFYPHPVLEPVQLLQTHISYILLTGEYAYKIKKPIDLGFLDFTSPEKRRHFCQEELRLNRRLSPELYLGVLPVVDNEDQYSFGVDDTEQLVADYALQMRQFPQDMLLSQLFQDGKLTPEMVQQLARQVAAFHTSAGTNPEVTAYGRVASIQQVATNNYAISAAFIGTSQTQQQLDETRTFTDCFFDRHADWFAQRQIEGKIRECHGDLHLNNVCVYRDKIQIFDCIEFNQEFRNIDVIYDAAFLVMDLAFRGRADLANLFLNTYLEQTGDYRGAALLPLYLSMRAYIRGNVNSLALNDPAISPSEKAAYLQRGQAYYRQAWNYTRKSQGRILLMSGLSGSGKSTVARQLAQKLNAIHLRSDAVRKHLAAIPLHQRGDRGGAVDSGIYTPEMTQKTYGILLELGLLLAQQGWPVILDAKYDRRALRQSVLEGAIAAQIPITIVECTAPVEVLRDRLLHRTNDITDATADLLDSQIKAAEPLTEAEKAIAIVLQTDRPLEPQLDRI
ncbi:AAA family ATPase [Altericista sp. CCNU0014]|uniref:bifunctional aminoglycoside phosphotransferase/ATP-binding protein n=1 Tax=Altericista sp. CCNU0014 TaxID=3082949 RepID=UPI00384BAF44